MQRKTDDEYGVLITREMKSMMLDSTISYETRAKIMCSILADEVIDDKVMNAFAASLKTGFIVLNNRRNTEISSRRERQKNYQKHLRTSTVDRRTSTKVKIDRRASPNNIIYDNINLNSAVG